MANNFQRYIFNVKNNQNNSFNTPIFFTKIYLGSKNNKN